ncbi:MAG: DUF3006 domain-containing protein [Clostridiales bacterium]|nr:DUF3006 domain-containing protein [Clostridiales bacterium]
MIILDRFEGEIAILEINGNFIKISVDKISPLAKEGDVLVLEGDKYIPDKSNTEKRKRELEDKFSDLWEE